MSRTAVPLDVAIDLWTSIAGPLADFGSVGLLEGPSRLAWDDDEDDWDDEEDWEDDDSDDEEDEEPDDDRWDSMFEEASREPLHRRRQFRDDD